MCVFSSEYGCADDATGMELRGQLQLSVFASVSCETVSRSLLHTPGWLALELPGTVLS